MLRLKVSSPVGEREVESDRSELVVGRREGVDILIDDPAASRNHCILRVREGRVQLIDLGSQNGVQFEGRKVSDALLGVNDSFRIGKTTITITSVPGATDVGLKSPDQIDLIFKHSGRGEVVLVIMATDPWTEDEGQKALQLQAKINAYLEYVTSGQLAARVPDSKGQPVRILIRTNDDPTPRIAEFIRRADEVTRPQGVTVSYERAAPSGLGLEDGAQETGLPAPIPHGAHLDFAREVRRALARTPWYVTSLIVHVIALFLLNLVPFAVRVEWPHAAIEADNSNDIADAETDLEDMKPPELERPDEILDDQIDDEDPAQPTPAQTPPEETEDPDESTTNDSIGVRRNFRLKTPLNVKPRVKQPGKRVDTSNIGREHGTVRDIVERGTGTGLRNIRAQNGDRIVVVRGDFDKMENILDLYHIKYTLIDRDRFLKGKFPKAYVVCINCARKPLGRRANRLASRAQRMVRGQGIWLITSDWALEPYLTLGWPGHVTKIERIKRRQPDTTITVEPALQSPLLAGVFGRRTQTRWWLEESSVFFRCSKRANVLIRSDDMFERFGARDVCFDFRDARGRVLHLLGHFWQEDGNVAGLVAMHKLILNFLVERFRPGG